MAFSALVAQRIEQLPSKQWVVGSIPARGTIFFALKPDSSTPSGFFYFPVPQNNHFSMKSKDKKSLPVDTTDQQG